MSVLRKFPSRSTPGKYHEIIEAKDGVIYCTCWAWKKNRTCRHLETFKLEVVVPNEQIYHPKEASIKDAIDAAVKEVKQE